MKTIGIFTTNETIALRKIIDIANDYKCIEEVQIIKHIRNKGSAIVSFSNGDWCKWIKPNSSLRGQKVTNAIIDIGTCSCDEISTIILPSIVNLEGLSEITIIDSSHKFYDIDTLTDRLEKVKLIKGNIEVGYDDTEWRYHEIMDVSLTEEGHLLLK